MLYSESNCIGERLALFTFRGAVLYSERNRISTCLKIINVTIIW